MPIPRAVSAQLVAGVVLLQLVELEQVEQLRAHRHLLAAHELDVVLAQRRAHQQQVAPVGVHHREVVAGVTAAALLALQRRLRHAQRDEQHVPQVQRQVPAGVELAVPLDAHRPGARRDVGELLERHLHLVGLADDADELVHRLLQLQVHDERVLPAVRGAGERQQRPVHGSCQVVVRRSPAVRPGRRRTAPRRARTAGRRPAGPTASCRPAGCCPCIPPEHSPAANRPGTVDIPVSGSTSIPPIT